MARYTGGSSVPGGYYLNARRFGMALVEGERGVLPGNPADHFVRVAWPVALLAAPVIGGVYVVILPFVGAAMLVRALGEKLSGTARAGARDLAATVTPGWRPGEAHLTGRATEGEAEVRGGGAGEKALSDVAVEIEKKRREESGS